LKDRQTETPKSEGTCRLCGKDFAGRVMAKHLAKCRAAHADAAPGGGKLKRERVYHLLVEGRGAAQYWMHIDIAASAALSDLDMFLRKTWLECCGHMSQFTIAGRRYASCGPDKELECVGMNISMADILAHKDKFYHEYDFGTTTSLSLKVVTICEAIMARVVRLLARNYPPKIPCQSCGAPAVRVCAVCLWEGEAWFCERCAENHDCENSGDTFLPVVNSPRVGMCGYEGSAEDRPRGGWVYVGGK